MTSLTCANHFHNNITSSITMISCLDSYHSSHSLSNKHCFSFLTGAFYHSILSPRHDSCDRCQLMGRGAFFFYIKLQFSLFRARENKLHPMICCHSLHVSMRSRQAATRRKELQGTVKLFRGTVQQGSLKTN